MLIMNLATALRSALVIAVLIGGVLSRAGAAPGDVDLSFDPGSGSAGSVQAAIVQPNGKYVVSGGAGITRLNSDGSNDTAFTPRLGSYGALALQPDGKVLAAHLDGIERLNPDGSLDASFQVILGPTESSGASAIVVQPDGKVLIGGVFSSVNGVAISGIARLNQNGSLDTTFSAATVVGGVFALALQTDGKVLVGGRFHNSSGVQDKSLLRLNTDGALDTSFMSATDPSGVVISLAVQPDGKVVAGGNFLTGSPSNIARLNANGGLDTTFNAGTGANDTLFSVALQSDGKLVIAGGFTEVNGTPRETLARLNSDGTLDTNFDPDAGIDVTNGVAAVTAQSDGKVLIIGSFAQVNQVPREGFARLENDGTLDVGFIPNRGMNGAVSSVLFQPNGKVLIAGDFTAINGQSRNGVARLNHDGSLDPAVFDRGSTGTFGPVAAIALQPDGKVLIGTGNSLVRVHPNGARDEDYNAGGGGAAVTALAVQPDGRILVGGFVRNVVQEEDGSLTTYHRLYLSRHNSDGSLDTTFEQAFGGPARDRYTVTDLVVQPDGKILVAGVFFTFKGVGHVGIARVNADGTLDADFAANSNGYINSVSVNPDGSMLVGGQFTMLAGTSRRRIARLHVNGSLDPTFDPGTGFDSEVVSLAQQSDGKVLVAGYFTSFDGISRSRIARLQANGQLDHSFVSNADGWVSSIAIQQDGKVLACGSFSTVNGVLRPRVARLESVFVSEPVTFSNPAAIPISDPRQPGQIGRGMPYPSTINVTGFAASDAIEKITVTIQDLAHELADDVDILLVGPGGQNVVLFSDAGGRQEPPAAVTLQFDDSAAATVPDDGPLVSGTYRVSDYESDDRFPSPAPSPSTAQSLATFSGTNPNGEWKLYVVDDEVFDAGSILGGWSINIHTGAARPEISVEQPAGTSLVDGTGSVTFGATTPGSSGDVTVIVRNLGGIELSGLGASIDGANASAFSVTEQPPETIAPNASGALVVRFSPAIRGTHEAILHLTSNDADESPFDIVLTGAGANLLPVAVPDTTTVAFQTAGDISVLANDSDPDGDLLSITSATGASHGTTEVIGTGAGQAIRYTPAAGYSGSDSFSYEVSDGFGGNAFGTVSVSVGPAPDLQSRTLFSKGAPVPGAGESLSGVPAGAVWKRFGVPSIAVGGRVAFAATIGTPGGTLATVHMGNVGAVTAADSSLYLIAKEGDSATGVSGASFASFKDPLLNDEGTIVFLAKLHGAAAGSNVGIWKHNDSQAENVLDHIARTGEEPTGVPGARWKAFTSVALSDGAGDDELIAFTATMRIGSGGVGKVDDEGLWLVRGTDIQLALREGATFELGSTRKTVRSFVALQPLAGAAGQGYGATTSGVLARVKFSDGTEGLLRASFDSAGPQASALALSGDPVADFEVNIETVGLPAQSNDGGVSFIASLSASVSSANTAILRATSSGVEVVVREGDQSIPGETATLKSFNAVAGGSGNRVAFSASLAGESVNANSDTGIWLHDGAELKLIAREAAQPPGVPPGAKWGSFQSLALPGGAAGPLFTGKLTIPPPGQPNPARITAANNNGIWVGGSSGALQLIARTGSSFDGNRTVTALTLLGKVPGSPSQARAVAKDGGIIYRITLSDGSHHLVTVQLP
jgi:uncharacterized delta-60 repeat protein